MINILEKANQNLHHIDLFSKLLADRIIFISEAICPEVVTEVQAQLLYLSAISQDPIRMYINSPGGRIYDGLGLCDTMDMVKKTCVIETINIGLCASMASVLLMKGTKGHRFSLPNCTTMIHQPSGGAGGQATDIEIDCKEVLRLKALLNKIIEECTGQDLSDKMERDCWLTAEMAKELGIIDEIK